MASDEVETPADTAESRSEERTGLPVVGIGASAGGLRAFEEFFRAAPVDGGMAFVLVQHLDPNHHSELPELLQNHTSMPVTHISDATPVAPDTVYIIPPDKRLSIEDGVLALSARSKELGSHSVIDLFFRALARDRGRDAVGIVLSGTGTDGTQGLKAIKEAGGITMAQSAEDAEYDGMPRSAVATGLIDFVLPASEMPHKLVEIRDHAGNLELPDRPEELPEDDASALQRIFTLVRTRTGRDFGGYKRTTVLRRTGRRMQMNGHAGLGEYLEHLREDASEVEALASELLISVTNFFRDPHAFATLAATALPEIFAAAEERGADARVRVWVPGCATGEEAYSLAILFEEHNAARARRIPVQVFASDVDERALEHARRGVYPDSIATDVSQERLERFFVREGDHFAVSDQLRDTVLFARHDLIDDPPFSKLDLVSCRNLLIYLQPEVQRRVFEIFHYALRPGRFLFLGGAESLGRASDLFHEVDHRTRLYRQREIARARPALGFAGPAERARRRERAESSAPPDIASLAREAMQEFVPICAVVDGRHDIVYLSGPGGRYLDHPEGEPTRNIVSLARDGLAVELRTALYRCFRQGDVTERKPVRFEFEGERRALALSVRPFAPPDATERLALVVFEDDGEVVDPQGEGSGGSDEVVHALEAELARTRETLQTTIEEFETSNEELRASNEELQSMNEELQSSAEELETSREELQSTNEELVTVNQELRSKIEELAEVNADLENLIASTEIGTLFFDAKLRLKRFTPAATEVFHLIGADLGRPLRHLSHALRGIDLAAEAEAVRDDVRPRRLESEAENGRTYSVRILPYRSPEHRVDGVVVALVDVTERKRAEQARAFRARLLENLAAAVIATDDEMRIIAWNAAAAEAYGYGADEAIGRPAREVIRSDVNDETRRRTLAELETEGRSRNEVTLYHRDGTPIPTDGVTVRLTDGDGATSGYLSINRDISRYKALEAALERAREELEERVVARTRELASQKVFTDSLIESSVDGILAFDEELRYTVFNRAMVAMTGIAADDALGRPTYEVFPFLEEIGEVEVQRATLHGEEPSSTDRPYRVPESGQAGFFEANYAPLREPEGAIVGGLAVVRDTTARKRAEDELRASEERFRAVFEEGGNASCLLILNDRSVVRANSRCAEVLGLPRERIEGRRLADLEVFREREPLERLDAMIDGGAPRRPLELMRDFDGDEPRTLSVTLERIRFGGEDHVLLAFEDVTDRRRAEEELIALRRRLAEIRESERQQLARDLHDGPLQDLLSVSNQLAVMRRSLPEDAPLGVQLQQRRVELQRVAGALRRSVGALRLALEEVGLDLALASYAEQLQEETDGIEVGLDLPPDVVKGIPMETQRRLWRIACEGLRNALRHAEPDRITVGLRREDGVLVLRVADDGKGFDVPARLSQLVRSSHFGLVGTEEEARLAGGDLILDSRPGAGTVLEARVPTEEAAT